MPQAAGLALWIAMIATLTGRPRDVQLRVATPVALKVAAVDQHGRPMRMRCVGQDTRPVRQLDSQHSDPICGLRVFSEDHAPARNSEMTAFSTEAKERVGVTHGRRARTPAVPVVGIHLLNDESATDN